MSINVYNKYFMNKYWRIKLYLQCNYYIFIYILSLYKENTKFFLKNVGKNSKFVTYVFLRIENFLQKFEKKYFRGWSFLTLQ